MGVFGCCCSCCGSLSFLIGACLIVLAVIVVMPFKPNFFENIHDLLYIDNTFQTFYEGPLGDSVSEKKQFDSFMKPKAVAYAECVAKVENTKADCTHGAPMSVSMFNVTNAEGFVLTGENIQVQELSAIHARTSADIIDVDTALWDSTGVAKYRTNGSYWLDPDHCDTACANMLQADVVIPNPVIGQMFAINGFETVLMMLLGMQAVFVNAGGQAAQIQIPVAVYKVSEGAEKMAWLTTFALEPSLVKKLTDFTAFAQAAMVAAFALGGGDATKTCPVGKTVQLSAMKCATALKILAKHGAQYGPASWAAIMTPLRAVYGTGIAAPLFIKVKVAQALGWRGATFTDPLTGVKASLRIFTEGPSAAGSYTHRQSASKFGDKGTSYVIKKYSAAVDCRWDPDCTLANSSVDSCTPSAACTPHELSGYGTGQFPGNLWGEPTGYGGHPAGKVIQVNGNLGISITFVSLGYREKTLPQAAEDGLLDKIRNLIQGKQVTLRYVEWSLNNLTRRLENCDGTGPGSPGNDCNGPKSTISIAHSLAGAPFWMSFPFFAHGPTMVKDADATNAGQIVEPFDSGSRVTFTKCTGDWYCDSKDPNKMRTYSYMEPETGFAIAGQSAIQVSQRVGMHASTMFPNIKDTLVPVWWQGAPGQGATDKQLSTIATVQNTPAFLDSLFLILVVAGAVLVFCGCCCGGAGIMSCSKEAEKPVAEEKATDTLVSKQCQSGDVADSAPGWLQVVAAGCEKVNGIYKVAVDFKDKPTYLGEEGNCKGMELWCEKGEWRLGHKNDLYYVSAGHAETPLGLEYKLANSHKNASAKEPAPRVEAVAPATVDVTTQWLDDGEWFSAKDMQAGGGGGKPPLSKDFLSWIDGGLDITLCGTKSGDESPEGAQPAAS